MSTRERWIEFVAQHELHGQVLAEELSVLAVAFAESEVRRALQPGEADPHLVEAEREFRARTEMKTVIWQEHRDVIAAELDRLRALLATKSGEATITAYREGASEVDAVQRVREHGAEANTVEDCAGDCADGEHVYEVTLTARRVP